MKTVIKEVEVMKQYTELVEGLIKRGRIMKIVGGSNSMYEYASHFEPTSEEFDTLLVALERKNDEKRDLGLEMYYDVDVFDLVVKNVKGTFDDGEVLYIKRFFRFKDRNKNLYVRTVEDVEKRTKRWSQKRGRNKKVVFNPTTNFIEKLKDQRGFTNAKRSKVEVTRCGQRGYEVVNTELKTKPDLFYGF